jgi:hypothetical protein
MGVLRGWILGIKVRVLVVGVVKGRCPIIALSLVTSFKRFDFIK